MSDDEPVVGGAGSGPGSSRRWLRSRSRSRERRERAETEHRLSRLIEEQRRQALLVASLHRTQERQAALIDHHRMLVIDETSHWRAALRVIERQSRALEAQGTRLRQLERMMEDVVPAMVAHGLFPPGYRFRRG